MQFDVADTIAAIASAPGGAPRGIIRVSGPQAVEVAARMACHHSPAGAPAIERLRVATRLSGELQLGPPLGDVPCSLFVWPNERSYTRQPTVEIHLPGSPPILQAALAALCQRGARLAQPGEFTLRAFLAGRLDLTQAEAVLGVIDATSQSQLDVALTQLAGGLAAPLHALRNRLLDLLAHLEAGLDFVEEDIEFISRDELHHALAQISAELDATIERMRERDAASSVFRVVLAGAPNVGKSSLLNALAGEEAAIVSPIAGTTRDYVVREIVVEGLRCQLIDTAGLAGATNIPDAAAEERTRMLIEQCDLVLHCSDAENLAPPSAARRVLPVQTKADLLLPSNDSAIAVSALTGVGLDVLRRRIAAELRALSEEAAQAVASTSARCLDSLRAAREAISRADEIAVANRGEELVAAELRLALEELGRVVGAVYTEDVLDRIFSRFCIGK